MSKTVPLLTLDNVLSVYSGKVNTCCCGCAGKYTYLQKFRDEASKKRGYVVKDEEINDRVVAMMIKKINAAPNKYAEETYVSFDTETRTYIAYLREEVSEEEALRRKQVQFKKELVARFNKRVNGS